MDELPLLLIFGLSASMVLRSSGLGFIDILALFDGLDPLADVLLSVVVVSVLVEFCECIVDTAIAF